MLLTIFLQRCSHLFQKLLLNDCYSRTSSSHLTISTPRRNNIIHYHYFVYLILLVDLDVYHTTITDVHKYFAWNLEIMKLRMNLYRNSSSAKSWKWYKVEFTRYKVVLLYRSKREQKCKRTTTLERNGQRVGLKLEFGSEWEGRREGVRERGYSTLGYCKARNSRRDHRMNEAAVIERDWS